jgi:hypothetical protein
VEEKVTQPTDNALQEMLSLVPVGVCAVAFTRAIGLLSRERPDLAVKMLRSFWSLVSRDVYRHMTASVDNDSKRLSPAQREVALGAVVLEHYFFQEGDWAAMEREMKSEMCSVPGIRPWWLEGGFVDSVAKQVLDMLKEQLDSGLFDRKVNTSG